MGRTTDVARRAIVRDLTRGTASYRIDWDVRTAFDFIFSLSGDAGSTDDLPAADRAWLSETRRSMPEDIQAGISDLFENELAIHAGVLLVDRPEARTSADVVEVLASLDPSELLASLFSKEHRGDEIDRLVERAIGGDTTAIDELAEQLPDHFEKGRLELLREPEAARDRIVAVLRAWQAPFSAIEGRILEILERDFDDGAADRERLAPADLIERTTGGVRYLPEPGVSRVILAPSFFSRPYNFLMSARDWRLFGYPVADSALGPSDALTPPLSVVRLHRALGDDTRLRILKLLASRDLYLTEIAQQLDLSKPTIKHHLAQLRAAGLVTVTESGTVMYYTLRRNRLDDASDELKRFLVN
jgi:DNA-binding transcriptional ArsR family regulator